MMENQPLSGTVSVPDSAQRIATKATKLPAHEASDARVGLSGNQQQVNVFCDALVRIIRFMRHDCIR